MNEGNLTTCFMPCYLNDKKSRIHQEFNKWLKHCQKF